jgi:hypothetical protein
MSKRLRWARELRVELATEIELLESGVLQILRGEEDISRDRLGALRERREEIETMIWSIEQETPLRVCL